MRLLPSIAHLGLSIFAPPPASSCSIIGPANFHQPHLLPLYIPLAPGPTAVVHSSSLICSCPVVVLILAKASNLYSSPARSYLATSYYHDVPRSYILTMMVHIYLDRIFNWDPYHSRPSFTSPGQSSHLPSTVAIEVRQRSYSANTTYPTLYLTTAYSLATPLPAP